MKNRHFWLISTWFSWMDLKAFKKPFDPKKSLVSKDLQFLSSAFFLSNAFRHDVRVTLIFVDESFKAYPAIHFDGSKLKRMGPEIGSVGGIFFKGYMALKKLLKKKTDVKTLHVLPGVTIEDSFFENVNERLVENMIKKQDGNICDEKLNIAMYFYDSNVSTWDLYGKYEIINCNVHLFSRPETFIFMEKLEHLLNTIPSINVNLVRVGIPSRLPNHQVILINHVLDMHLDKLSRQDLT